LVSRILAFNSVKEFLNKIDDNAYDLINIWKEHKEITNDEKLANLYGKKVTIVRSILNKLCYRGVVIYDKVKDKDSGWYNYYWKIDFEKLAKIIYSEHKDKKAKINEKTEFGTNYNLFCCKNECKLIPFEVAAEYNFVCPHCNESLAYYDYNKKINELNDYLRQIEKEMEFIKTVLQK